MMFFSKVYESWDSIQKEKYEFILGSVGKHFFSGRILDIGSGRKTFAVFLKRKGIKAEVTSLDIDPFVKPDMVANGNRLPFKTGTFDVIVSIDAMHLTRSRDFKRVLKKSGLALFSIFYNDENYLVKKRMLKSRLTGFEILKEFSIQGREKEYVVVAKN